jgi:hypothetical protein
MSFSRANLPASDSRPDRRNGTPSTSAVGIEEMGVRAGDELEYPLAARLNPPAWGTPVIRLHHESAGARADSAVHVAVPGSTVARPGSLT